MSTTAGSDTATTPKETRGAMILALHKGVHAGVDGGTEDDCPWPKDGNRAQRSARIFWMKGFHTAVR